MLDIVLQVLYNRAATREDPEPAGAQIDAHGQSMTGLMPPRRH